MKKRVTVHLTEQSGEIVDDIVRQFGYPVTCSGLCAWIIEHYMITRGDKASIIEFCAERNHSTSMKYIIEENKRLKSELYKLDPSLFMVGPHKRES